MGGVCGVYLSRTGVQRDFPRGLDLKTELSEVSLGVE